MTDNRSERLRRRRKQSTEQAAKQGGPEENNPSKPSKTEKTSKNLDPTDGTDTDRPSGEEISIKEELVGTYMYLPKSQTKALRRQYNILKAKYEFEYEEEFEKNRHFYALVVQYGLDSLEGLDASDIQTRLEEIMD